MRDEQQGDIVVGDELADFVETFFLKGFIAHGEGLVDDEDLGMDVRVDGEAETGFHTARVGTDRLVHVLADVSELDDLGLELFDLFLRQTEGSAAQVDVLPSGHLPFEARGELEEGGDAAIDGDLPFGREADSGDHLEDGGLAGAVAADEGDRFTGHDRERHVVDGVLGLDVQVFEKYAGKPLAVAGVEFVTFGNVFEFDDGFHSFFCHCDSPPLQYVRHVLAQFLVSPEAEQEHDEEFAEEDG